MLGILALTAQLLCCPAPLPSEAAHAIEPEPAALDFGSRSLTTSGLPDRGHPSNLIVPDVIQPLVRRMWHQSPTFRRQCARLAEHPEVTVHVELTVGVQDARARARLEHHTRRAVVQLEWRAPERYVEYIAHELEHVLEQLDGVDLPGVARRGVDGVVLQAGEYETVRAQSVGRTVAGEVLR